MLKLSITLIASVAFSVLPSIAAESAAALCKKQNTDSLVKALRGEGASSLRIWMALVEYGYLRNGEPPSCGRNYKDWYGLDAPPKESPFYDHINEKYYFSYQ